VSESLPPALRGRDIVCVGFADWDNEIWTNQHHLMARLAQDNRLLFVESLGLRRPTVSGRDLRRIARRVRRGLSGPRRSAEGVWVLSPLVLPLHGNRLARALNARLLPALVRRAARRIGMRRPILWAYVPHAEVLLDALDPERVVYHCVDDLGAVPGIDAGAVRAAEARFVPRADLVLASAPPLAERMRTLSEHVIDAPNVADTELFATALEPGEVDPAVAALPEPRIVFAGAVVTTKLDLPLLVGLARLRRDWSIALVGPVGLGDPNADVSPLEAEPNIHLLGGRPHDGLPAVLRGAAAGLIPYAINPITASVFPMKVYEYLAAGLPVVATPLPSLRDVGELRFAATATETAAALEELLASDSPQESAERSRRAAAHSWDARLQQIADALEELG
jgi:glycosyltransferase involved in cell wall biosynthesis